MTVKDDDAVVAGTASMDGIHAEDDRLFTVLADPDLRAIVEFLCRRRDVVVEDLTQGLGFDRAVVSADLNVLAGVGLVTTSCLGHDAVYAVNLDTLDDLIGRMRIWRVLARES